MSQLFGSFMRNDQHKISNLLSLLTKLLDKVDFFQLLTFWSTLGQARGQTVVTISFKFGKSDLAFPESNFANFY